MLALLSIVPTWLKIGALALAGAALLVWASYTAGKHEGRQQAAMGSLQADLNAERERTKDDATMQSLDDYHFCVLSLRRRGLPIDRCEQLRGISESEP